MRVSEFSGLQSQKHKETSYYRSPGNLCSQSALPGSNLASITNGLPARKHKESKTSRKFHDSPTYWVRNHDSWKESTSVHNRTTCRLSLKTVASFSLSISTKNKLLPKLNFKTHATKHAWRLQHLMKTWSKSKTQSNFCKDSKDSVPLKSSRKK